MQQITFASYRVPIYTPGWRAAMWIKCLAEGQKVPGIDGIEPGTLWSRVKGSIQYTTAPPWRITIQIALFSHFKSLIWKSFVFTMGKIRLSNQERVRITIRNGFRNVILSFVNRPIVNAYFISLGFLLGGVEFSISPGPHLGKMCRIYQKSVQENLNSYITQNFNNQKIDTVHFCLGSVSY